jgi:NAD(P)-dependent dehydrogenase (short-subunit alcohol dehydrogenase family)
MSKVDFEGRAVVVTGAGGGIGRAYALVLAQHGARVVVNDLGGDVHGDGAGNSMADSVVEEIRSSGGEAIANYDSVSTPEGGDGIVAACLEAFGAIDGLIHNAGILRDKSLANMDAVSLESVLDVHLRGGFHLTVPAFRAMKEQKFGRIVLTSSSSGLLGNFGQSNYGAAKMGLVGLMHVAAIEGARYGILANVIAPGARTRMTEDLLGDMAHVLDPEHVAPMGVYLASPQCSVSHEIFSAAGGRFARYFLGVNRGWYAGEGQVASPSDIEERLSEIRDVSDFEIYENGPEEMALLVEMIRDASRE